MPHLFFYLGLSFILLHEMDAIRCKEWRIFPGLHLLNDHWGYQVFLFAHIPLYMLLFYGLIASSDLEGFIQGLNIFMIIHLFLHILFLRHKKNEFKDWISWLIIIGAAVCGGIDLFIG